MSSEDIDCAVEETVGTLKQQAGAFALEFARVAQERSFFYGPVFAIDVCPVWNAANQKIEFHLLEVQAEPGTEGAAGNIPPDEQLAVDEYNQRVASEMSTDMRDLMY